MSCHRAQENPRAGPSLPGAALRKPPALLRRSRNGLYGSGQQRPLQRRAKAQKPFLGA